MEHTSLNIGTININTITNSTKLNALRTFIRTVDLDIVFLQEVENDQLALPGFNVVCNVDHARRGTAIALKEHIIFSHIEKSLDGRLVALRVHNTTLCNVYAPYGSVLRTERERFYNNTIAYYLRHRTDHIILGGDFNCVIRLCDATGSNSSPALQSAIQQLRLLDVWQQLRSRESGYTYITHNSSSRLDRFYVSANLREHLRATKLLLRDYAFLFPTAHPVVDIGLFVHTSSPPRTLQSSKSAGSTGLANVVITHHGLNGGCLTLSRNSNLFSVEIQISV